MALPAVNNYYIDPGGTPNSGDGSVGSPWTPRTGPTKSALQHALDTIVRDATDGDRINIKAGTADVQTASLSFASYGTPSPPADLWIEGYTAASGDGGIGEIDLDGLFINLFNGLDYTHLENLKIHNFTSPTPFSGGRNSTAVNVEIENGWGASSGAGGATIYINNYVHNIRGRLQGCQLIAGNYLDGRIQTGQEMIGGINARYENDTFGTCCVYRNILNMSGDSNGINHPGSLIVSYANTVISSGCGTGKGIVFDGDHRSGIVLFNLIEGFTGPGGIGIDFSNVVSSDRFTSFAGNAAFNCETGFADQNAGGYYYINDNDMSLAQSPFAKGPGDNTFANRANFFAPISTGSILTSGIDGLMVGAIRSEGTPYVGGVATSVGRDGTPTAGNWIPTPAHTNVNAGGIASELTPANDEVVISFNAISWGIDDSMAITLSYGKRNSIDQVSSTGDTLELTMKLLDGATTIFTEVYSDVQGTNPTVTRELTAGEAALISASPDLRISLNADTTATLSPRKILVFELGMCHTTAIEAEEQSSSSSISSSSSSSLALKEITIQIFDIIESSNTVIRCVEPEPTSTSSQTMSTSSSSTSSQTLSTSSSSSSVSSSSISSSSSPSSSSSQTNSTSSSSSSVSSSSISSSSISSSSISSSSISSSSVSSSSISSLSI